MKKNITLPALALCLGGIGAALRYWELSSALDPATGLMRMDRPATWLLLALAVAFAVAAVLLCRGAGSGGQPPEHWFLAPETGYIFLVVCAALLLMAAAGAGFAAGSRQGSFEPLWMVLYALSALDGLAMLGLGRGAYRMQWKDSLALTALLPSLWALVWLVAFYQTCSRQPVLLLYVYPLLAVVSSVLANYEIASLALSKGGPGRTCVFCLLSIFLSLVGLAGGYSLALTLMFASNALYLTAQAYMLLRGAFGPPWPKRLMRDQPDGTETESPAPETGSDEN